MAGKAKLELMKIKTYKDSILKGIYDSLKIIKPSLQSRAE
jgi:hypothetical protein